MFGQYPLQVNGFKDLHECLEAAMIEGEIESLHSAENSARSGQEVSVRNMYGQDQRYRQSGLWEPNTNDVQLHVTFLNRLYSVL